MPGPHEQARLRVAIDATPLLGRPTGVGVFARSVIGALAAREDVDLSAFCVSWRTRRQLGGLLPEGVSSEQRAMPARPLQLAWSRSEHPRAERFLGSVDALHGTNFTVPPSARAGRVVTVHDLTCIRFPEMCEPATLRYPRLIARALRSGAVVHTPSEWVAEEVREHFRARREQVVSVHSGIPELPPADPGAVPAGIDLSRPFILSAGTAEPRKDLPGLVAAFSAVAARVPDLQLVLAGPSGWGADELELAISSSAARDRILRTGFVSDGALGALISSASVLAYPSRYEGFGFPPLQAMQAGVPVVTTTAGALREICGGAAIMVEPGDVDGLGEALESAATDSARRSIVITAGLARAGDFSWDRTAEGLVGIYRTVAQR